MGVQANHINHRLLVGRKTLKGRTNDESVTWQVHLSMNVLVGSVLLSFMLWRKRGWLNQRKWSTWLLKGKLACKQMWFRKKQSLLKQCASLILTLQTWLKSKSYIPVSHVWLWDTSLEARPTSESKHLSNKCFARVSVSDKMWGCGVSWLLDSTCL